jgi:hypothetical protein
MRPKTSSARDWGLDLGPVGRRHCRRRQGFGAQRLAPARSAGRGRSHALGRRRRMAHHHRMGHRHRRTDCWADGRLAPALRDPVRASARETPMGRLSASDRRHLVQTRCRPIQTHYCSMACEEKNPCRVAVPRISLAKPAQRAIFGLEKRYSGLLIRPAQRLCKSYRSADVTPRCEVKYSSRRESRPGGTAGCQGDKRSGCTRNQ